MAKSKGTSVWWGRKEQTPLPKKPRGLGSARAARGAWLPGLSQRTGLTACRGLYTCPLGPSEARVQGVQTDVYDWGQPGLLPAATLPEGTPRARHRWHDPAFHAPPTCAGPVLPH